MTDNDETPVQPAPPKERAPRMLEAGLAAFAATTGALLAFAYQRGDALLPFTRVGRRVARDIALSTSGDAVIGIVVHLGHCMALGAATVLLRDVLHTRSRLRAALLMTLVWQMAAFVPWLSVIRADMVLQLSSITRAGLAVLLVAALALGPRAD